MQPQSFETRPRSRSVARALLNQKPMPKEKGPRSPEQVLDERARLVALEAALVASALEPRRSPGRPMGKSVRGSSNKADKAGKVGKTGRLGRHPELAPHKPRHKKRFELSGKRDGRHNVRGPGQGRGAQRGARGKSGSKLRSPPLRKRVK
jgi:hypothetical protein